MGGACSTPRRKGGRILVGKLEGNRPLQRPRCRFEDNIEMDLTVIGWDDTDWIYLIQDRE
jgi:hypothetical protein